MSRLFSTTTTTDRISVGATNLVPERQGPITVLALVRVTAAAGSDQWFLQAVNSSGNPVWGLLISGGKLYNESNFGSGGPAIVLNSWMWVGFTKGDGNLPPRWHAKDLTAGTAWTHIDDGSNVGNNSGPPTGIVIGGRNAGTSSLRGNMAAAAVWNRALSDAEIESATTSAQTLNLAHPQWGVLLNQASASTAVTDLSGFGASQVSISGTTVDASEPPGWNYTTTGVAQTILAGQIPSSYDAADSSAYTLGLKFSPDHDGFVTHARVFNPTSDQTNPSSGSPLAYKIGLFNNFETQIASNTFPVTGWSHTNWIELPFVTPIPVTAGSHYTVGWYTPNRYSVTSHDYDTFRRSSNDGNVVAEVSAGVFAASSDLVCPSSVYNNNNYFVDLVYFADSTVAPSGPTFKVWNGTAEVAATVKLWDGSSEVAVSLSSIT